MFCLAVRVIRRELRAFLVAPLITCIEERQRVHLQTRTRTEFPAHDSDHWQRHSVCDAGCWTDTMTTANLVEMQVRSRGVSDPRERAWDRYPRFRGGSLAPGCSSASLLRGGINRRPDSRRTESRSST